MNAPLNMLEVSQAGAVKKAPASIALSCPFCGAEPNLARQINGVFLVGCENDDCPATPQVGGNTLAEAWGKWNGRAA